jgi:hypothetical protein
MAQDALPGLSRVKRPKRTVGRVERAVSADLTAARRRDTLPPDTGGLAAAARAAARALDDLEADREASPGSKAYALTSATRSLLDTYAALGLTGGQEGGQADAAAWLDSIGNAEIPHSP